MNGKIALITGAARRIGEAIARAFVQESAHVYLTDMQLAIAYSASELFPKLYDHAREAPTSSHTGVPTSLNAILLLLERLKRLWK